MFLIVCDGLPQDRPALRAIAGKVGPGGLLELHGVVQDGGALIGILDGLGLHGVPASEDGGVNDEGFVDIGEVRGQIYELGYVGVNSGTFFGHLVRLGLVGRGTVEVVATEDDWVHGDRLVDVKVVRGQFPEGIAFGKNFGTLIGVLLGLLGRAGMTRTC